MDEDFSKSVVFVSRAFFLKNFGDLLVGLIALSFWVLLILNRFSVYMYMRSMTVILQLRSHNQRLNAKHQRYHSNGDKNQSNRSSSLAFHNIVVLDESISFRIFCFIASSIKEDINHGCDDSGRILNFFIICKRGCVSLCFCRSFKIAVDAFRLNPFSKNKNIHPSEKSE